MKIKKSPMTKTLLLLNPQNDFVRTKSNISYKLQDRLLIKRLMMANLHDDWDDIISILDIHHFDEAIESKNKHCLFGSEGALMFSSLKNILKKMNKSRFFVKSLAKPLENNISFNKFLKTSTPIEFHIVGYEHDENELENLNKIIIKYKHICFKKDTISIFNKRSC